MGRDQIEEQTLIDLSQAQREALACRWPLILANAGLHELAEEFRRDLTPPVTEEPA